MNTYQSWNSESQEKSKLVKHSSLASAFSSVETQMELSREDDAEGWRIQSLRGGPEMTLAEAKEQLAHE
jgi:hypothetical protein